MPVQSITAAVDSVKMPIDSRIHSNHSFFLKHTSWVFSPKDDARVHDFFAGQPMRRALPRMEEFSGALKGEGVVDLEIHGMVRDVDLTL